MPVTNIWAVTHENRLVRWSPHALGFSRSNPHDINHPVFIEAPWPLGSCSSCPHPGPPLDIADPQQTLTQTPSRFTTRPQQSTNKNSALQSPYFQPVCFIRQVNRAHSTLPPPSLLNRHPHLYEGSMTGIGLEGWLLDNRYPNATHPVYKLGPTQRLTHPLGRQGEHM